MPVIDDGVVSQSPLPPSRSPARFLGVVAPSAQTAIGIAGRCRAEGMHTHVVGPVLVAFDPRTCPTIGFAKTDDGSFVVLDGEVFDEDPSQQPPLPDQSAALVLGRLIVDGGITALIGIHFEGVVTFWNARLNELTVVRDPGGLVPAFIAEHEGSRVWSTELDSLMVAGIQPMPDRRALDQQLAVGWVTPPQSFLCNVDSFPAGHAAVVRQGGKWRTVAWCRRTGKPELTSPIDEQGTAIGAAITRAVERRSHGSSVGAFLSSGIDSTVIVAVLRRILGRPVETFTFHYGGYEGPMNEAEFAAQTARLLGATHHRIDVTPDDLVNRFGSIVAQYQSPLTFGIHSFKQDLIGELGFTAVLSGNDLSSWSYYGRSIGPMAAMLRRLPIAFQLRFHALAARVRGIPKLGNAYQASLLATLGETTEHCSQRNRRALLGASAGQGTSRIAESLSEATRLYAGEPLPLQIAFVMDLSIAEYVGQWNHRWSRAFGHSIRHPLLDIEVADVVNRRTPRSRNKPQLRAFAATLLPPERSESPKVYQEMPLGHWFRGPLRDFVHDTLAPQRLLDADLVEPEAVNRLIQEHLTGEHNHTWTLWTLITATEWALQLRARPKTGLIRSGGSSRNRRQTVQPTECDGGAGAQLRFS